MGLWDWRAGQGYKGLVRKYGGCFDANNKKWSNMNFPGCVGAVKEISTQPGNKHFAAVGLDRSPTLNLYQTIRVKRAFIG